MGNVTYPWSNSLLRLPCGARIDVIGRRQSGCVEYANTVRVAPVQMRILTFIVQAGDAGFPAGGAIKPRRHTRAARAHPVLLKYDVHRSVL